MDESDYIVRFTREERLKLLATLKELGLLEISFGLSLRILGDAFMVSHVQISRDIEAQHITPFTSIEVFNLMSEKLKFDIVSMFEVALMLIIISNENKEFKGASNEQSNT